MLHVRGRLASVAARAASVDVRRCTGSGSLHVVFRVRWAVRRAVASVHVRWRRRPDCAVECGAVRWLFGCCTCRVVAAWVRVRCTWCSACGGRFGVRWRGCTCSGAQVGACGAVRRGAVRCGGCSVAARAGLSLHGFGSVARGVPRAVGGSACGDERARAVARRSERARAPVNRRSRDHRADGWGFTRSSPELRSPTIGA